MEKPTIIEKLPPGPERISRPDAMTYHTITRLRGSGKYCEIWLEPPLGRAEEYSLASKWDELERAVDLAGLHDVVLNGGYRGLRVAVKGDHIEMLSTSASRPAGVLEGDE